MTLFATKNELDVNFITPPTANVTKKKHENLNSHIHSSNYVFLLKCEIDRIHLVAAFKCVSRVIAANSSAQSSLCGFP